MRVIKRKLTQWLRIYSRYVANFAYCCNKIQLMCLEFIATLIVLLLLNSVFVNILILFKTCTWFTRVEIYFWDLICMDITHGLLHATSPIYKYNMTLSNGRNISRRSITLTHSIIVGKRKDMPKILILIFILITGTI